MKDKKILRSSMFGYKKNDCLDYIKNLDDILKKNEDEKNTLLKKESEYLSEIDNLSAKNTSLEKNIDDKNNEISGLQNKIEELEKEAADLKEKITSMSNLCSKHTDENSCLKKDNDELKEKIISLISERDDISIKYNKLYTYYEKNKNEISEAIILSKQQGEEIVRKAKSESEKIIKDAISEKERIYKENDEKLNKRIFQLEKTISEKNLKKEQLDKEINILLTGIKDNFKNTDYVISQFKTAFSDEIDKILIKFSGLINKDSDEE